MSDLIGWLYRIRCTGEKKLYVHSRKATHGEKNQSKNLPSPLPAQSGQKQELKEREESSHSWQSEIFPAWKLCPENYFQQRLVDLSSMNLSKLLASTTFHAT